MRMTRVHFSLFLFDTSASLFSLQMLLQGILLYLFIVIQFSVRSLWEHDKAAFTASELSYLFLSNGGFDLFYVFFSCSFYLDRKFTSIIEAGDTPRSFRRERTGYMIIIMTIIITM
jgi:hypothetical protein